MIASKKTIALIKQVEKAALDGNTQHGFSVTNGLDCSHVSKVFRGITIPSLEYFNQLCHAAGLEICLTTKKK